MDFFNLLNLLKKIGFEDRELTKMASGDLSNKLIKKIQEFEKDNPEYYDIFAANFMPLYYKIKFEMLVDVDLLGEKEKYIKEKYEEIKQLFLESMNDLSDLIEVNIPDEIFELTSLLIEQNVESAEIKDYPIIIFLGDLIGDFSFESFNDGENFEEVNEPQGNQFNDENHD